MASHSEEDVDLPDEEDSEYETLVCHTAATGVAEFARSREAVAFLKNPGDAHLGAAVERSGGAFLRSILQKLAMVSLDGPRPRRLQQLDGALLSLHTQAIQSWISPTGSDEAEETLVIPRMPHPRIQHIAVTVIDHCSLLLGSAWGARAMLHGARRSASRRWQLRMARRPREALARGLSKNAQAQFSRARHRRRRRIRRDPSCL